MAVLGKVVAYVMADGSVRPMQVTALVDQPSSTVNGVVTLDGDNDQASTPAGSATQLHAWVQAIPYSDSWTPRTWHWST